jgi:hypothetical protein
MKEVKSKQNPLAFFSFAYGWEEERKRNFFGRSDIMAPGISYRKSETRWLTRLGASESKRRGKSFR